jgi:hypothetical protein
MNEFAGAMARISDKLKKGAQIFPWIRLHFDAQRSQKYSQLAHRQRRYKVVAARDGVGEAQDAVTFKSARKPQDWISADVISNFALYQLAESNLRGFYCRQHSSRIGNGLP